jgi:hypothetical protein
MTPESNRDEIAESVTKIRDMIDELRTVVEHEIPILNDVVKPDVSPIIKTPSGHREAGRRETLRLPRIRW